MPKEPVASSFEQWIMRKPALLLYWVAQPVVKTTPMVIFKQKNVITEKYTPSVPVVVHHYEKSWMDNDMMDLWLSGYFINLSAVEEPPRLDAGVHQLRHQTTYLCYWQCPDSYPWHSYQVAAAPWHLCLLMFQGRTSSKLGELDETSFTATGRMRRASYSTVCQWVLEAWNAVPDTAIMNGFD